MSSYIERRLALIDRLHRIIARVPPRGVPLQVGRVKCPDCGQVVEMGDRGAGEIDCPNCGGSFTVSSNSLEAARDSVEPPERIHQFRILERVGQGAFGSVYRARDEELGRVVAVKAPRRGTFSNAAEEERFLREARSAARLQHPAIVRVLEIGSCEGLPYIVSDFIEGRTLAAALSSERPSFRKSADLMQRMARALDFAHADGVVHRDIKPANILIDGAGRPYLGDFGLARRDEDDVTVTLDGQILGTPAYMSPEQAAGESGVGPLSDVYSLGVVLYELLTGERPFRGSRSMLVFQVLNEEPRAPRTLNDHIPRDLETICLKAMAKERSRRYASARLVADDLARFLDGEPIAARPMGRAERLWRWCRRKPLVAGLAAAVVVLLMVVVASSAFLAVHSRRAQEEAMRGLARLTLAGGAERLEGGDLFGALPWVAESLRLNLGDEDAVDRNRFRFETTLARCPRLVQMWFFDEPVYWARFSPDCYFVLTQNGPIARLWDADSGDLVATFDTGAHIYHTAFSPDGRFLATSGRSRATVIWDVPGGQKIATLGHRRSTNFAAFSADGRYVVTASSDRTARVWEAATGDPLSEPLAHGGLVQFVAFHPDGERVATGCSDGFAQVWNWRSGRRVPMKEAHEEFVTSIAFSPDGRRVLTSSHDDTARVWDADTGEAVGEAMRHGSTISSAAFSPDGTAVVTSGRRGLTRLWDATTGKLQLGELKQELGTSSTHFSPDGRRVLASNYDTTVRFWDTASGEETQPVIRHARDVFTASVRVARRFSRRVTIRLPSSGTSRRLDGRSVTS